MFRRIQGHAGLLRLPHERPEVDPEQAEQPEREAIQAGAELIGLSTTQAVIEVLLVAIEALEVAGVTGITVDLTLPDLVVPPWLILALIVFTVVLTTFFARGGPHPA